MRYVNFLDKIGRAKTGFNPELLVGDNMEWVKDGKWQTDRQLTINFLGAVLGYDGFSQTDYDEITEEETLTHLG